MSESIALTVDLEPDWGIEGARAYREVTPKFLRFIEDRGITATFFIVSDLLDTAREPVAAIAERNEVASHGCSHRLLSRLGAGEALEELRRSRLRLQEFGKPVRGFRAPFFARAPGHFALLRKAGYCYDASMGSVLPGPHNGRLSMLDSPCRREGVYEFSTCAACCGLAPFSLTYLRLLAPVAAKCLSDSPSLLYLHLHEFLPPQTAACLPLPLRRVLTRNCGRKAWDILDRTLTALGGKFRSCGEILDDARQKDRGN
ncbi:MAG: polysaccharide deacetylase family protein [Planctomycetes bacterium]|nr:polysaccharide deacetylase family protein [Planctomycetota bacterium]